MLLSYFSLSFPAAYFITPTFTTFKGWGDEGENSLLFSAADYSILKNSNVKQANIDSQF
jgi:hypothetical protein